MYKAEALEISVDGLKALQPDAYQMIDIRDRYAFEYGHIPGAMHVPLDELTERAQSFSKEKLLILYCKSGQVSPDAAVRLKEAGCNAASLTGGYYAWMRGRITQKDKAKKAEQSIRKTFHKELWSKFAKAVKTYELVQPGDKIAVCISGGKESMLMAKLFQELQWHKKFPFELVFLVMDPGYSPENREIIEMNAKALGVPLTVFESNIFEVVYTIEKSPCYLCARMRRGYLYREAQKHGCNKIALGHHYNDVIETTLMEMLYGAQIQTMMPKLHSTNFPGMELIRPMYLIREDDIIRWRDYNDLHFIQCACRFTDTCTTCTPGNTGSKRMEIKHLIRSLKEVNPHVENHIFKSMENVNLETVIGYKDKDGRHSFLDTYDGKTDSDADTNEEI